MPAIIQIRKSDLEAVESNQDSKHVVVRAILKKKEILEALGLDGQTPITIFRKEDRRLPSQEEAAFSSLYQADIGESAARTVLLVDESEEIIGVASIGLSEFIEYGYLWDKEKRKKYIELHPKVLEGIDEHQRKRSIIEREENDALLSQVFTFDEEGNPNGFKVVKGLASVLLSSWLYAEDDLHRRNFGLARGKDGELYWARLDFGMSFSSITHGKRPFRTEPNQYNAITLRDLMHFPNLKDANPFYFPTVLTIKNSTANPRSINKYTERDRALFATLEHNPIFIREKHQWLLKQFIILVEQKKKLLQDNIDEPRGSRLANSIENRILTLRWTAICDPAFRQYIEKLCQEGMETTEAATNIVERSELHCLLQAVQVDIKQAMNLAKKPDLTGLFDAVLGLSDKVEKVRLGQAEALDESYDVDDGVRQIFAWDIQIEEQQKLLQDFCEQERALRQSKAHKPEDLRRIQSLRLHMKSARPELDSLIKQRETALETLLEQVTARDGIQNGLKFVQKVQAHRAVLAPLVYLMVHSDSSVPPKEFFRDIYHNWVLPYLEKLPHDHCDQIYQSGLLAKLRNIQRLFNEINEMMPLPTGAKLATVKGTQLTEYFDFYKDYKDLAQQKMSGHKVEQYLSQMEKRLLKLKYFSRFDTLKQIVKAEVYTQGDLADVSKRIQQAINFEIKKQIDQYYLREKTTSGTDNLPLIKSLGHFEHLFKHHFTSQEMLYLTVESEGVSELERKTQAKAQKRYTHAMHAITKLDETLDRVSYLAQVEFILSRLSLDLAVIRAESRRKSERYEDFLQASNLTDSQYKALIKANKELSHALAYPDYHDTLAISDVAWAAVLGAEALNQPSAKNACACLHYADTLAKSHQTRLATKVATGLAVVGALILGAALAILLWPVVLPTAAVVGVSVAAGVAGTTMLSAGGYATYRFFRDKDKVKRKLEDVASSVIDEQIDQEKFEI